MDVVEATSQIDNEEEIDPASCRPVHVDAEKRLAATGKNNGEGLPANSAPRSRFCDRLADLLDSSPIFPLPRAHASTRGRVFHP